MAIMNSTNAYLTLNGTKIANLTNVSFGMTMETRETTNKDSGGNASFLEGKKSWTASGSAMLDFAATNLTLDDLYTLIQARSTVFLVWDTAVSGDSYFYGSCFITELSTEGGVEDNQTYSISFQGTGAITKATTT